jgi:beta-phosphoglucomutase-like phosphatase (HAD superfamily)
MTDIEPKEVFRQKAIDLINEYRQVRGDRPIQFLTINTPEISAFIRSIQLHEKTKQELHDLQQKVSDIASAYNKMAFTVTEMEPHDVSHYRLIIGFEKSADASMCHDRLVSLLDFLNPKPKPDPLVAAMEKMGWYIAPNGPADAENFRAALDALGFEIREKGQ